MSRICDASVVCSFDNPGIFHSQGSPLLLTAEVFFRKVPSAEESYIYIYTGEQHDIILTILRYFHVDDVA